jgi:orotate phosphoribosyltransferase
MSPEGLVLIGQLGLKSLQDHRWDIHAIGGLTLGADPVAYAIAYSSARTSQPIRAFTVRKEAKTHGAGRLVEGPIVSGDQVAIVEDVITTGSSALRAISAVRSIGAVVVGVLAVVDREEGGREALEREGLHVVALTTATEIVDRMP